MTLSGHTDRVTCDPVWVSHVTIVVTRDPEWSHV